MAESTIRIRTRKCSENICKHVCSPRWLTDSALSEDGIVQIAYNSGETIQNLRFKLEQSTGYPAGAQRFSCNGMTVADTTPLQDFGRDSAVLTLGRVDTTSSKAPDQVQYKHSYRNVEAEEMAEQYMGNIGIFPSGSMVGSHTYEDVKGKGQVLQVLGDMASFPPGFGSRGKNENSSQP